MFCIDVPLDLLPDVICNCWGLAMTTVNNDITGRSKYSEASFVEFLEFFARLASVKFKDGSLKLEQKISMLMDLAFGIINAKRKEVVIEIQYVSQSEEEMDEEKYFI